MLETMGDNRHPELAGDHQHFLNCLRGYLGLKPLYLDGRTLVLGHDRGGEGHSDIGLRWMDGLTARSSGRVLPSRRPE